MYTYYVYIFFIMYTPLIFIMYTYSSIYIYINIYIYYICNQSLLLYMGYIRQLRPVLSQNVPHDDDDGTQCMTTLLRNQLSWTVLCCWCLQSMFLFACLLLPKNHRIIGSHHLWGHHQFGFSNIFVGFPDF